MAILREIHGGLAPPVGVFVPENLITSALLCLKDNRIPPCHQDAGRKRLAGDNRLRGVDIATRFGRNLARCRRQADMSQEELGALASLHRTEIGMLERGGRLARIDTLIKLAGALEIAPGDLLDGLDWRPGPPRVGQFKIDAEEDEEPGSDRLRQG
jgi:transcriptional regulator with XRE-family HTH domain